MKDKDAQLMMEAYREGIGAAPAPQDDELASYVSPDSTKLNQTLQDIGDKLYDELLDQLRKHSSKFGDIMKQAHGAQLNKIIDAVAQSMKDKDNPLPHTQIPGPDGPGTVRRGDGRVYHMKGKNL
jgi:hypothetical protein